MPRSINGTGTLYYGSAEPHPDGSSITTEWITLFWLPLIPLRSMRIWYVGQEKKPWWSNQTVTHYKVLRVPLHIPHVIKAYAISGAIFGFLAIADYLGL